MNDQNICKSYWIDIDKAKQNIIDAVANIDRSKLIVMANVTSRNKIEEMGIDPENVIFKPVTLSKLKTILSKSANTTPQLIDEAQAAQATKFDAKVLVTEDNIINQKLIKRILEEHGITVDLANNGLECFEKRRNNDYDLLFMDIQMPVMDGIEATHEILDYEEDEEVPHVPIVALTANALKGDRERFLGEGMDEYITKPIETSELLYVLNRFLSAKATTVSPEEQEEIPEESTDIQEEAVSEVLLDIDEPIYLETENEEVEIPLDEVPLEESEEKKILIAKKFLLERRVLAKVLENLGYEYKILEDINTLENELASGAYDILFSDADLITENISSQSNDNLVIITSENSKENIQDIIKKHRG